jgi:hypothetical protein
MPDRTKPLSPAATQPMPVLPTFTSPPKRPRLTPAKPPRRSPWYGRLITMAVLLLVYLAGYSGGRDAKSLSPAATQPCPLANHPACHPNLKP